MTRYQLSVGTEYHRSVGHYESYGIALITDGSIDRIIRDISPDRERVEELVRLFNDEDLDPVHFSQAVEDFLLEGAV